MKAKEVRELSPEEMGVQVSQFRKQWIEMKMQHQSNPGAVKSAQLGQLKKTVARLLTVQRERQLGVQVPVPKPAKASVKPKQRTKK